MMRVFVAGASGAIGSRLVPQLIERGHEVIGTFRSEGNFERVRALGGEPLALDLLEPAAVRTAVLEARPDAIVHQATALANLRWSRNMDRVFAQTNRLRTEGTDALLAAAREAGVRRFVAQSFASYRCARVGGPVKTEDDPLDPAPPAGMRETAAAMRYLDQAVTDAGGIALRYGGFYNIVDDEPAPVREWLPVLANVLGAKPPRHFPRWLARLFAGEVAVMMATEARGASNAKAKRELAWTLRYPSWRKAFVAAYAATAATDREARLATQRSGM